MSEWYRVRFRADEDARPIKWPPPGPYWCSGYTMSGVAIVVAYVRDVAQIAEFWPDSHDLDWTEEAEITFSSRFAEPDWWRELNSTGGRDE